MGRAKEREGKDFREQDNNDNDDDDDDDDDDGDGDGDDDDTLQTEEEVDSSCLHQEMKCFVFFLVSFSKSLA